MLEEILLASPRGFCAGVVRAIDIVELALQKYGTPLYVRHAIVHNEYVVKDLERKGATFVEDLVEVPEGSRVVFSAHGSPAAAYQQAEQRRLHLIEGTCPLVTKVHKEAKYYHDNGYSVVLIGHAGHQEVIGTMGQVPMQLVQNIKDVVALKVNDPKKIAVVTQTTLSLDDTGYLFEALKAKYPFLKSPPQGDICYATQNRQDAVKELVRVCDSIFVVGSKTSSNSNRLVEVARSYKKDAWLISDRTRIENKWFYGVEKLGITSGASTPELLVEDVVANVQKKFPEATVKTLDYKEEDVSFGLPKELAKR